ncbi:MAG: MOSC domain-containing protein, partial [Cypionkella sp.]|nr:MOSC domain-containing protein [Cypionkella sp.]
LNHPETGALAFRPDDPLDLPHFLQWIAPLSPPDRAQPIQIVSAGRGMTDSAFPSVSILSLTSLGELSGKMGRDLSIDRWRGNLWIDGAAPFAEFDWIGHEIKIGAAVLRIEERITRCRATMANPVTGQIDADTLTGLQDGYGHQDFGVYATVISGGILAQGDKWNRL